MTKPKPKPKTTTTAQSRPRLGRGLASLIVNSAELAGGDGQYTSIADPVRESGLPADFPGKSPRSVPVAGVKQIPTEDIAPNPFQPRGEFGEEELAELTQSILQQGIIQPLIVTPAKDPAAEKPYVLIAGERRLRAARLADLPTVPCVVKPVTQQQMIEWALVENIQRTDLNPVEKAQAYRRYMDRFSLTQAQVGEKLGQARATIANYLRILELHEDVQGMLVAGSLSFGHAKVLAGLIESPERQLALARKVVSRSLSVRQLEGLVEADRLAGADTPDGGRRPGRTKPAYLLDLEERLTQAVGTRVTIKQSRAKGSGKIVVEFYSLDDFDRIAARLGLEGEG